MECTDNINYCHHTYIESDGYNVCIHCGHAKSDKIYQSNYEKAYTQNEIDKRIHHCKPNTPLIVDFSMSTYIETSHVKDFHTRRVYRRDRKYSWNYKNLSIAVSHLRRIGHILSIPYPVLIDAKKLYQKARDQNLVVGRSIYEMAVASLYYCTNISEYPIPLIDFVNASDLSYKQIFRGYSVLSKKFNLASTRVNYSTLISQANSKLNLTHKEIKMATDLLTWYKRYYFISKVKPSGLIAGIYYYIVTKVEKHKSQHAISTCLGVTPATLRQRYYEILDMVTDITKNIHRT